MTCRIRSLPRQTNRKPPKAESTGDHSQRDVSIQLENIIAKHAQTTIIICCRCISFYLSGPVQIPRIHVPSTGRRRYCPSLTPSRLYCLDKPTSTPFNESCH